LAISRYGHTRKRCGCFGRLAIASVNTANYDWALRFTISSRDRARGFFSSANYTISCTNCASHFVGDVGSNTITHANGTFACFCFAAITVAHGTGVAYVIVAGFFLFCGNTSLVLQGRKNDRKKQKKIQKRVLLEIEIEAGWVRDSLTSVFHVANCICNGKQAWNQ